MTTQTEKAPREKKLTKEGLRKIRHEWDEKWNDNLAKGLTGLGLTKKFEGKSQVFYLNGVRILATVDYDIASAHIEFQADNRAPSVISETGYRSHFTKADLKDFETMRDVVKGMVAEIMWLNQQERKSKKQPEYTLTFKPSLEYLSHSPEQLSLFDMSELAR